MYRYLITCLGAEHMLACRGGRAALCQDAQHSGSCLQGHSMQSIACTAQHAQHGMAHGTLPTLLHALYARCLHGHAYLANRNAALT